VPVMTPMRESAQGSLARGWSAGPPDWKEEPPYHSVSGIPASEGPSGTPVSEDLTLTQGQQALTLAYIYVI
jgi:hypothetical protein